MNILFLTIVNLKSIERYGMYSDLLRCFKKNGHKIYTVSTYEKRTGKETECIEDNGVKMLHVKVGNITKCNVIEKGLSTITIEKKYKDAIKKYYSDVKFDLLLYSTPPITFAKVIQFVKKRDGAKSYLMLKDIFPQNAVDLGMMKKNGLKGILYRFFRNKEKKLYAVSDRIGCMSQANVDYVIQHNPDVKPEIVEVCPNSIEVRDMRLSKLEREIIRNKYDIPIDKKVFVYGGNLGKPQGIPFLIECLKTQLKNNKVFFLVVGEGTEYTKLEDFFKEKKPSNMRLMKHLPKEDYDRMVAACDVGMIFLDHRFTIPNFPSRLLSYMQAGLPVLACTDTNTDIGKVIVGGGFGWWCESNSENAFKNKIQEMRITDDIGEKAWIYLKKNYTADISYQIIINWLLIEKS